MLTEAVMFFDKGEARRAAIAFGGFLVLIIVVLAMLDLAAPAIGQ